MIRYWAEKDTDWRFTANSMMRYLKVYPNDWYKDTAYGVIRGRKFPLAGGYDEELTFIYGDYMSPPADRSIYIRHLEEEDVEN